MKASSILKNVNFLRITDFENALNVSSDLNDNYVYNLNETLVLNITDNLLYDYTCKHRMFWPLISHKIYGTTRLAWMLMKINKVDAKDIFIPKEPGDIVKYIRVENMKELVAIINKDNDTEI